MSKDKLQDDLTKLQLWADNWQMTFNTKKCRQLSVRKREHNVVTAYTLYWQTLESVDYHPYLGVELQSDLKWDQHIHQVTAKANRSLGFLRRNLSKCLEGTKKSLAYQALVRSHLEYASAVWGPHLKEDIKEIETVQRRAARFVKSNYIERTAS